MTATCSASRGDSGASVSRWDGSFGNSCRDASVNSNGVLTANCQTMNGNWNRSSLSPSQCGSGNWNRSSLSPSQCGSYRAGNRDGTLFCE